MAGLMELTPEKIAQVQAMLLDNPELAKLLKIEEPNPDETEEETEPTDVEKGIADLKAMIAEMTKVPVDDKLKIDPTANGDPSWGYAKGLTGLGEMAIDVHQVAVGKGMSPRLNAIMNATKAAGAGLQENVDSEGGFLIPDEQRSELLEKGIQRSEFMSRTTQIPMASNTVTIPTVVDTTHSGGTIHGGIRMYWVAEEGSLTKSQPAFGQVRLSLNKLAGLAYATSEMLEDSPISLGPLLSRMFTDAWSWQMDNEILNGSGTGKPRGILNEAALVSQTIETEQQAATIVTQNILKMYARMPAYLRQDAIWIANDDTFSALATMTLDVGTGGVPVYLPADGLANQPNDTLMGKPLVFTEHCQTLGTVGDIYFAALREYLVGTKAGAGVRQDTSIHFKFDTDESAFRFIWRVDGKSWWTSENTPANSSVTQSPFVALAVRE